MEIKVQSIKFDADQKLIDYVNRKVSKLEKFYEDAVGCEVALSLLPDPANKGVYERNYRVFKKLYKTNASNFKDINGGNRS